MCVCVCVCVCVCGVWGERKMVERVYTTHVYEWVSVYMFTHVSGLEYVKHVYMFNEHISHSH